MVPLAALRLSTAWSLQDGWALLPLWTPPQSHQEEKPEQTQVGVARKRARKPATGAADGGGVGGEEEAEGAAAGGDMFLYPLGPLGSREELQGQLQQLSASRKWVLCPLIPSCAPHPPQSPCPALQCPSGSRVRGTGSVLRDPRRTAGGDPACLLQGQPHAAL